MWASGARIQTGLIPCGQYFRNEIRVAASRNLQFKIQNSQIQNSKGKSGLLLDFEFRILNFEFCARPERFRKTQFPSACAGVDQDIAPGTLEEREQMDPDESLEPHESNTQSDSGLVQTTI
jgi:hypothetical protein